MGSILCFVMHKDSKGFSYAWEVAVPSHNCSHHVVRLKDLLFLSEDSPAIGVTSSLIPEKSWLLRYSLHWPVHIPAFQGLCLRVVSRKKVFQELIWGTFVLRCCSRKRSLKEHKSPKWWKCWYCAEPSKAAGLSAVLPLYTDFFLVKGLTVCRNSH